MSAPVKLVENCTKAIERAKALRALKIFIKETFETAQTKALESQSSVSLLKIQNYQILSFSFFIRRKTQ